MSDVAWMQRAIALAMRGRGGVEPNPMVGCVLVREGRVIGEGWHAKYGENHAEANALQACLDARGATAYVTLEPCCHTNKQTPPCVPRLIAAGVSRVVIATLDPNPQVSGRGVAQLCDAGIAVDLLPASEASAQQLIAPYLARTLHQRPYVTLKWAESMDGYISGPSGARLQITGEAARAAVMRLRARSDAIVVGVNTVLRDDPLLLAAGRPDARPLTRYVLDPQAKLVYGGGDQLLASYERGRVVVCCVETDDTQERIRELREIGFEVIAMSLPSHDIIDLSTMSHLWHTQGHTHVLIESGGRLASHVLKHGCADRIWRFTSSRVRVEDASAVRAVAFEGVPSHRRWLGDDLLEESFERQSDVFFADDPSADFVTL